jgi:hypothetical protein
VCGSVPACGKAVAANDIKKPLSDQQKQNVLRKKRQKGTKNRIYPQIILPDVQPTVGSKPAPERRCRRLAHPVCDTLRKKGMGWVIYLCGLNSISYARSKNL